MFLIHFNYCFSAGIVGCRARLHKKERIIENGTEQTFTEQCCKFVVHYI